MKPVAYSREEIAKWVGQRMDYPYPFAKGYQTLCKVEDDEIIAGVVFENYLDKRDIHMHVAAYGRWATKDFLEHVFSYPFGKLGCERVTGFASDPAKVKFYRVLGFTVEGRLRRALKDGDLYILGMLKDECKYYGQTVPQSASAA